MPTRLRVRFIYRGKVQFRRRLLTRRPNQRTPQKESFESLCDRMSKNLAVYSYTQSQSVRYITPDEMYIELLEVLWKAWSTYDPAEYDDNMTIEKWWWFLWTRHKSNLVQKASRLKRTNEVLVSEFFEEDKVVSYRPTLDCPIEDDVEGKVWVMLAEGYTALEVKRSLGLSASEYNAVIDRFRTDDVRAMLAGESSAPHGM